MSDVVVVTPRSGALIELALVKQHLRVEHSDHDDLIADHVEAAAIWLDGPKGWLGLSLGLQTLRLDRVGFGGRDGIELPCGPVQSIEDVTYLDSDGSDVSVDADVYALKDANRVRLVAGKSWPAGCGVDVSVTYVAGYAADALPAGIRNAILLHVKILYGQPEGQTLAALERSRDDLLNTVRVWRV